MTVKETVSSIEHSMQLLSNKYDELLEKTREQDREVKDLKKRVAAVERQDDETSKLKQAVNDLEWRSRRCNLEIHGMPLSQNEDLLKKVNDVATKLGVSQLSETDVAALHRLQAKSDKIPGVIVRFARQSTRDKWFNNKGNLDRSQSTVYILENMTRQSKALFWASKEWARENHFKYVWYKNGKVYVRKVEGERVFVIKSEADLTSIPM